MKLELDDILTIGNSEYMIVEMSTFMDKDYLLLNKLDQDGEPLEEFYVYRKNEDGVLLVNDKKLLDILLPIFANKLQREINFIINQDKYNIE